MALTKTRDGIKRIYDEKECWDKYMAWGAAASQHKLRNWLRETKGIKTSRMGPFFAMWRHAIKNPEATYPQYRQWFFESASAEGVDGNASFEDFLQDLKHHGKMRSLISQTVYTDFCEKYNLGLN